MNDVVAFLGEPVHQLRRLLAVHELERPRRDELDVGAVCVQRVEMALGPDLRLVERSAHLVVGDLDAAAAMRAARRQQPGLVGPELRRRADMTVTIDDHAISSHCIGHFR